MLLESAWNIIHYIKLQVFSFCFLQYIQQHPYTIWEPKAINTYTKWYSDAYSKALYNSKTLIFIVPFTILSIDKLYWKFMTTSTAKKQLSHQEHEINLQISKHSQLWNHYMPPYKAKHICTQKESYSKYIMLKIVAYEITLVDLLGPAVATNSSTLFSSPNISELYNGDLKLTPAAFFRGSPKSASNDNIIFHSLCTT